VLKDHGARQVPAARRARQRTDAGHTSLTLLTVTKHSARRLHAGRLPPIQHSGRSARAPGGAPLGRAERAGAAVQVVQGAQP
jgi:hypothetical protein